MSLLLLLAMRALLLDTSGRCVEITEHCPTQRPRSWDIYPRPCTLGGGCFPRCRLSGCFSALCAEAERVRTVDENCLVQSFWCTVSGAFIANRTCNWKIGVLILDSKWAPDGICYKYNLNQKASLSKMDCWLKSSWVQTHNEGTLSIWLIIFTAWGTCYFQQTHINFLGVQIGSLSWPLGKAWGVAPGNKAVWSSHGSLFQIPGW